MKKEYESPKVEKVAFDYSDAVVASTSQCIEKYYGSVNPSNGQCKGSYQIEYTNSL